MGEIPFLNPSSPAKNESKMNYHTQKKKQREKC
jgi:hypothetical protein